VRCIGRGACWRGEGSRNIRGSVRMCIDVFAPGRCLDVDLLWEQIWIKKRDGKPDQLDFTEVYDLLITNPEETPLREVLVLFPHDCTFEKMEKWHIGVKAWPVCEAMPAEVEPYSWPFVGAPKESPGGLVERTYFCEPRLTREQAMVHAKGRTLRADVSFPNVLGCAKSQKHMRSLAKTAVRLTFDETPLGPGEKGWLLLEVKPRVMDGPPRRAREFPVIPHKFSFYKRLEIVCPVLVRESLYARLGEHMAEAKDTAVAQECNRIKSFLFDEGIYRDGTSTRIIDQRISLIARESIELGEPTCTKSASFYGSIPLADEKATGLWWGAGSQHNETLDIHHLACRAISKLEFVNRKEKLVDLVRDLAPSAKHEAFSLLVRKMIEAGLLECGGAVGSEEVWLASASKQGQAQGLVRLRKLYARFSTQDEAERFLLAEFSDLHPFQIAYKASWVGWGEDLEQWIKPLVGFIRKLEGDRS